MNAAEIDKQNDLSLLAQELYQFKYEYPFFMGGGRAHCILQRKWTLKIILHSEYLYWNIIIHIHCCITHQIGNLAFPADVSYLIWYKFVCHRTYMHSPLKYLVKLMFISVWLFVPHTFIAQCMFISVMAVPTRVGRRLQLLLLFYYTSIISWNCLYNFNFK